jgi:hypothetical protein
MAGWGLLLVHMAVTAPGLIDEKHHGDVKFDHSSAY